MQSRNNQRVPLNNRAEKIADCVEKDHWHNPPKEGDIRRIRRTKVTSVEERGTRERIVGTDMTKSAAENRVPPKLAEHLGRAMRTAWEKLQSGK